MTNRPEFDPSVYETAELAELNRPLHALAWDMIEAERKLTSLNGAPRDIWDAQFAIVAEARAKHAAALDHLELEVAAYMERAERAALIAEAAEADERAAAEPTML